MKRAVLVVSVFVILAAVLAVTPAIVGNSGEADERRTATGPMWGNVGSPSTAAPPPDEPSRAKGPATPGANVPEVAKPQAKVKAGGRAAELEKLKKMYAREGMTPELMKRLAALRAAQGGGPAPSAVSPKTMQNLARQREEMRKRMASAPNQKPPKPPADQPVAVVMGKVTSRQKVALTPDAVLKARLLDITRADAPRAIAEQSVANPGKLPTAFVIGYSRQNVDPKHKYAVQVTVEDRGAVRWKTTAECKPVSEGRSVGIEIALQPFKAPEPALPSVHVGDVPVTFDDARPPFRSDGHWMLPVAPVLKAAGMETAYSPADKVLTVAQEGTKLSAALPGRTVLLGDGTRRELTAAITVRDGAVYAPMQFLQIATGRKALFDRESNAFVLLKM